MLASRCDTSTGLLVPLVMGELAIYKTRDSAQVAIDWREMSLGIPSTCVP